MAGLSSSALPRHVNATAGTRQGSLDAPFRQGYLDGVVKSGTPIAGPAASTSIRCSFCGKDKNSVAKLVAGPGVFICNVCVDLCNQLIPLPAPELSSWEGQSDDELLASLARIQAVVSQVDVAVHHHVSLLRERGISWTRIGETLGVSKQAAWERFSGED